MKIIKLVPSVVVLQIFLAASHVKKTHISVGQGSVSTSDRMILGPAASYVPQTNWHSAAPSFLFNTD
jgi:hypothetical protein